MTSGPRGTSPGAGERAGRRPRPRAACPFVVGRPVDRAGHVGRRRTLRTILERLLNGESVYVNGGPRIGKSSLLRTLAEPGAREELLGEAPDRVVWVPLDAHGYGPSFGASHLWEHLAGHLAVLRSPRAMADLVRDARERRFDPVSLHRLFSPLERARWIVVLAVDEADVLVTGTSCEASTWEQLRTLAGRPFGLTVLFASRLPRRELQARIHGRGSECFNQYNDQPLGPFDDAEVSQLLERGGERLSVARRAFVRRLGGRLPVLLQAGAQALWSEEGPERCATAVSGQADAVFPGLLDLLRPDLCFSTFVLGMAALAERRGLSTDRLLRSYGHRIDPHLALLDEQGFARRGVEGPNPSWILDPLAFAWWVSDQGPAYARTRSQPLEHEDLRAIHDLGPLDPHPSLHPSTWAKELYDALLAEAGP